MPDARLRCPVCRNPIDLRPGESGRVLCLRCGSRVEPVPVDAGPVVPVAPAHPLDDTAMGVVVASAAPAERAAPAGVQPAGAEPAPPPPQQQQPRAPVQEPEPPAKRSALRRWGGVAVAGACVVAGFVLALAVTRFGGDDARRSGAPGASAATAQAPADRVAPPSAAESRPVADATAAPPSAPLAPPVAPSTQAGATRRQVVVLSGEDANERLALGAAQPPTTSSSSSSSPAVSEVAAALQETDVAPQVAPLDQAASAAPAPPAPPARRATTRPAPVLLPPVVNGVSDEQIGAAIQNGVDWIIGAPGPGQTREQLAQTPAPFPRGGDDGQMVLAVYALLQCGKAIDDPRLDYKSPYMAGLLDQIKRAERITHQVYTRSLRAQALALFNRPEDRVALAEDVKYLVRAGRDGRYSYDDRRAKLSGRMRQGMWDNSNSQFGLLGVWAGAEAGVEVGGAYWQSVENHWRICQAANGQWAYVQPDRGGGTASMTAAGTTSLFVAQEYLDLSRVSAQDLGRPPLTPALKKAMRWWADGDNAVSKTSTGYTLYGVGRVGLASGYKHLGPHDWYRRLGAQSVAAQKPEGFWGTANLVETSFHLLFLARGRHPILMNKLAYDGHWANRPRDTANLARYAGRRLEREFNWQVVNLSADWTDWLDSPVLYIGGHVAPKFTDADLDKLRAYVQSGGMIFTHADGGREELNTFAAELAAKLFRPYELTNLPTSHPVYSVLFDVKEKPPLKGVRNGARLLMVHSPQDLSRAWQRRDYLKNRALFETGVNLFVYAAGKRDYRNRLDIGYWQPHPAPPTTTVPVARLRYAGNWDPEPGAWRHYAGWFKQHTGMALDVKEVALKDLQPGAAPVAHLTGTGEHKFTGEERAALTAFVEAGGVVVADPCGGGQAFADAVRQAVTAAFPDAPLAPVPRAHPLLNTGAPGMEDLSAPKLRLSTTDRRNAGNTYEVLRAGAGCVLLAPIDVTCGLLGVNAWEVRGYEPAYAQKLMKNTIFWALDGRPAD